VSRHSDNAPTIALKQFDVRADTLRPHFQPLLRMLSPAAEADNRPRATTDLAS
jgi:hypothetical protein